MSRAIRNPNLAALCRAHAWKISELACALKCTRMALHLYAAGRKRMPILEGKLAGIFKMRVPEFRKLIFSKGGKHAGAGAADQQVVHVRRRKIWRYDATTQRETWLNRGERFAADTGFKQMREDCMRYPHGAFITARGIGKFAILTPFQTRRKITNQETNGHEKDESSFTGIDEVFI